MYCTSESSAVCIYEQWVSAVAMAVASAGSVHKGCHHEHPHSLPDVCRTVETEVSSQVCERSVYV